MGCCRNIPDAEMKPETLDPDNAGERNGMSKQLFLAVIAAGWSAFAADGELADKISVSAYGSFDVSSGYVLYGALMNDEPCFWTYAETEASFDGLFSAGISLWQNSDMTCRRKDSMRRMNEWDWSAFLRSGYDLAEGWRIQGELGHVWYKYHGLTPAAAKTYATMGEIYLLAELQNPFLMPYITFRHDHKITHGEFFEGGLKREFELPAGFSLTPDATAGGGSRKYLAAMYPPFDSSVNSGLSYVQLALTISYRLNEHFGVHAKGAFAALADDKIRSAVRRDGGTYKNEFFWFSAGIDWSF